MSTPEIDPEVERYAAKHRRLRGTDQLRYPPNAHRCRLRCGLDDMRDGEGDKQRVASHQCFLGTHEGRCEFSSECGLSRFKSMEVVQ